MKRLMVTGASGFVGGSVLVLARNRWETLAVTRAPRKVLENTASWVETLDITDRNRLRACMVAFRPDAVIHAAALADIDYCERHPETAFAVNTTGTNRPNGARNSARVWFFAPRIPFSTGNGACTRKLIRHPP